MKRSERSRQWGIRGAAIAALALAVAGCDPDEPAPITDPVGDPVVTPDAGPTDPPPPTVLCTAPTAASFADGGMQQWGCPDSDEVLDVVVDAQGRVLLAGYERGSLDANITPTGDARAVLWTLPPDGAPTKAVLDLQGSPESLEALALHPASGAAYFVGRTTGAFPGWGRHGQQDLFVGEVAPDGALRVRYQGGDAYPQHPTRLAFDGAGGLLVAGYDDTFVEGSAVQRWEDGFFLRLREGAEAGGALEEVWWGRVGSQGTDFVFGLGAGAADGSFYVSGVHTGGATKGPYAQKRDAQGALVWDLHPSNVAYDALTAVHVLADGSVLVAGTTFLQLGAQAYGEQDAVVQKLDGATGQVLWTAQVGSVAPDWVTDLAVDPVDGSIALVGETLGSLVAEQPNAGDFDVFLARLDADGKLLGAQQWGSAEDERPTAVALDAQGRAFVGGYTHGALAGPLQGERDAFLLVTAPTRP